MNDPRVLRYWEDWQKLRKTAEPAGWTFAGYVAARVQQERGAIVTTSTTSDRRLR